MSKELMPRDPTSALAPTAGDVETGAVRRAALLRRGERFAWNPAAVPPDHLTVVRVRVAARVHRRSPVPRLRDQAATEAVPGVDSYLLAPAMDRAAVAAQSQTELTSYSMPTPAAVLRSADSWLVLLGQGQTEDGGPSGPALARFASLLCSLAAVELGHALCCDATRYLFPTDEHALEWLIARLEQDVLVDPLDGEGASSRFESRSREPTSDGSEGPQGQAVPSYPSAAFTERVMRETRDEFGRKVMRSFVDVVSTPLPDNPRQLRNQLAGLLNAARLPSP